MASPDTILVTGFGPYADFATNPSEELAKAVDGRLVGACVARGVALPVHHARATATVAALLDELDPVAVLHLGLAGGRARIALERVAVNVLDYPLPDIDGRTITGEPVVAGGPAAYFTTLPAGAIVAALVADGIPAYVSNTAGTYLCNQTLYATLHAIAFRGYRAAAGFMHLPFLPSMVAARGTDEPSMDFGLMLRAVETALRVIAGQDGASRKSLFSRVIG